MFNILLSLLTDLLQGLIPGFLEEMKNAIGDMLKSAFLIEELPGLDETVFSSAVVSRMLGTLYGFMILLLALKLIWKGWKVYVLWRDGESETPPGEMVVGAVYAVIVAVAFPILYEIAVQIVVEIADAVFVVLPGFDGETDILDGVLNVIQLVAPATNQLSILTFAFVIAFIALVFIMLGRGAEMLVYRMGIPFAVIGLVDSDGGAWRPYIQLLFRQMATTLVQYFCLFLGLQLVASSTFTGLAVGIAFEVAAFSTPKLLNQVLAPSSGGGAAQKIQTIGMVLRVFGG